MDCFFPKESQLVGHLKYYQRDLENSYFSKFFNVVKTSEYYRLLQSPLKITIIISTTQQEHRERKLLWPFTHFGASFTENDFTDLIGSPVSPGLTLDLSSFECCTGFYIYAQTSCGHFPSQFPNLPFTVQDPWRSNSVFWSQRNTK